MSLALHRSADFLADFALQYEWYLREAGEHVITLRADFNHVDAHGRLRLEDLRMHTETPFAQIAAKGERLIFVDGEDVVRGELIHDPQSGWMGKVDWSTQDVWESYPPAVATG